MAEKKLLTEEELRDTHERNFHAWKLARIKERAAWRKEWRDTERAREVADGLRNSGEWIPELVEELCELAGLGEVLERVSDAELSIDYYDNSISFEDVVEEAASRFFVEIY